MNGTGPGLSRIGFRRLEEGDLPLLWRWLNTDLVKRWYSIGGRSPEQVAAKYLPRIRGEQPTDCYLILYGGAPIGLVQTYMVRDYPEYARSTGVDLAAAGLDLFIGEEAHAHLGLGAPILRQFVREVVFGLAASRHGSGTAPSARTAGAALCVVGPESSNRAAIRAYEKAHDHQPERTSRGSLKARGEPRLQDPAASRCP